MPQAASPYLPRRPARVDRLRVRGLEYALHAWPALEDDGARPPVVLLHGYMDSGATWQFLVDALPPSLSLTAPDWRGFGASAWAQDGYWFPDYYADLDALLARLSPDTAVDLVGHSMGGNIALTFAGLRPERVRRVVSLEGFGLPDVDAERAPGRLREWLQQVRDGTGPSEFPDVTTLAAILQRKNPRLRADRAAFIAAAWSEPLPDGRVRLRADPAHRRVNPVLYRRAESHACWSEVRAPVLYLLGAGSEPRRRLRGGAEAEAMRASVPHLEAVEVDDAGHMLHHDRPEAVAARVAEFLAR